MRPSEAIEGLKVIAVERIDDAVQKGARDRRLRGLNQKLSLSWHRISRACRR
jgi:hypothetical protein